MTTTTQALLATPPLLRRITFPLLLATNATVVTGAAAADIPLEPVTMGALLSTLGGLFVLERLMPHREAWHPSGREWLRDLAYFALNGALDAGVKTAIAFAVAAVGFWDNGLPLWLGLPLAFLVADFIGYWLHRWGHAGWLWKVHGVHHTPDKVNTWNNNTIHFFNGIYGGLGKALPLMLLGFDETAIVIASFLLTLQSFAVHANIDVTLGRLGAFVMGPEHHRLHHSTVVIEAGNFATSLTVWDRLFGTFTHAPGREPESIGVEKPGTFPIPNDILRNQLHPFIDVAKAEAHR